MLTVFPDYYKDFKCIKGRCRHNCCIGWEIDIDKDTLDFYHSLSGEFGKRLKCSISSEDTPHFVLDKTERCPFLNRDNLCDIIIELGEEHICQICTDHPRFYNELPDRIETGLGLCCEEAARLIITKTSPTTLEINGESDTEDEIIALRDKAISLIQNRTKTIPDRIADMLSLFAITLPKRSLSQWAELLLSLERLDEKWGELLSSLKEDYQKADIKAFDAFMAVRQTEYEQLLVYLIYRHLANAVCFEDAALYAAFAALMYQVIHALGAVTYTRNGAFSIGEQIELCRMLSSEIEYSDENIDLILSALET